MECIANTAYDWQLSGLPSNVHTAREGDFSQAQRVTHTGAMLVGTYEDEERSGGLPVRMGDFRLFDEQHRSSKPLNLAYEATLLADMALALTVLPAARRATRRAFPPRRP